MEEGQTSGSEEQRRRPQGRGECLNISIRAVTRASKGEICNFPGERAPKRGRVTLSLSVASASPGND